MKLAQVPGWLLLHTSVSIIRYLYLFLSHKLEQSVTTLNLQTTGLNISSAKPIAKHQNPVLNFQSLSVTRLFIYNAFF